MVDLANRFRPGTNQRGEDTRQRILETAFELFGSEGFEGASTRALAERAGVNLPAIQYYFGSKEGLYRAVIGHIAEQMEARVAPLATRIMAELAAGQPERLQLIGRLCDLLDVIVSLIFDDSPPDRESRRRFFLRIEIERNVASDTLQASWIRHVLTPSAALVARLVDRPPDDEQVQMRAIALLGQAKAFSSCGAERMLGWQTIGEDRVRAVQALLREHTTAVFRARGDATP
jgi:AcrR family transcriptional regulator